jgi:acyl carrier protein
MPNVRQNLLDRVRRVLNDVFLDDSLIITENTELTDIPEWDSMLHVTLIMALEREFNIRLDAKEASESVAICPLLDLLTIKLEQKSDPLRSH